MNRVISIRSMTQAALLLLFGTMTAFAADDGARAISPDPAIATTMTAYEAALNASDTSAVMPLYTEDGIFMPPYSHSAIGTAAVRKAYDDVFKVIKLTVKFKIEEIVQMSPEWAFVRTNSAGYTTVNATGKKSDEGNQELFIFKRASDGKWRIARYSFSSTNAEPGK